MSIIWKSHFTIRGTHAAKVAACAYMALIKQNSAIAPLFQQRHQMR